MGIFGALRGKREKREGLLYYPPPPQFIALPERDTDKKHWEMLSERVKKQLDDAKKTREKYG